jgi:hypothetical protein
MDIVYTNRRDGEKRVHIELTDDEVAALSRKSPTHAYRLRVLIEEADRRLSSTVPSAKTVTEES